MSYYVLTKCSIPGWEFGSVSLEQITGQLYACVCGECCKEAEHETEQIQTLYPERETESTFIDEVLNTHCGLEFLLNEYDDSHQYGKILIDPLYDPSEYYFPDK